MSRTGKQKSGDAEVDAMFTSIEFEARFENHTSHTATRDPSQVTVVEFAEKGLVLEVPAKSVNVEHQITLEITQVGVPIADRFTFAATGKVHRVEPVGEDRVRVEVELLQYDEPSWIRYQEYYSARQAEITAFLASVNR